MFCRFVLAGLTKATQNKIIKWAGAKNMVDPGLFCEPCHTIRIIYTCPGSCGSLTTLCFAVSCWQGLQKPRKQNLAKILGGQGGPGAQVNAQTLSP
jgi:hypothetical protein